MTGTTPAVVMDETGNTGENLLDPEQPVFALAALNVCEARAQAVVGEALARTQMPELKFAALRGSNPGRRNVLMLLRDAALTSRVASTSAAHKPWTLAAKLVDELVEPTMTARGVQLAWYSSGAALEMVQMLYTRGRASLGELYEDLARAFVPLVRDYRPDVAREFLTALRRCRIVCRDRRVSEVLNLMVDTELGLAEEFAEREDALDPAIPLLFAQGCHWSEALGAPFEFIHDDSPTIERWKDRLVMAEATADPHGPIEPVRRDIGGVEMLLPTGLQRITFSQSDRDSRLQLADILAGATAHVLAVVTGARPPDQFARDLYRLGVPNLLGRWVGPDFGPADTAELR